MGPAGLNHALRVARHDGRERVRARRRAMRRDLEPRQRELLRALRRDGYVVVRGHWERERALTLRDRLAAQLGEGPRDFESGAYLRVQSGGAYDAGISRLFHVERMEPELAELRRDRFVLDLVAAYYGRRFHSSLLLYQHNPAAIGGTRDYHVDSFARESKAFLYLDDVDEENGPFAYLRGSQRLHLTRMRKLVKGNRDGPPTGFARHEVERLLEREVHLCGPAGTLIVADVRGLHRGVPQLGRPRSVLVNYLVEHPGDAVPAR